MCQTEVLCFSYRLTLIWGDFYCFKIPVFKGCASSLLHEHRTGTAFHGHDGFGDVVLEGEDEVADADIRRRASTTEHASVALCRLVSENPGSKCRPQTDAKA